MWWRPQMHTVGRTLASGKGSWGLLEQAIWKGTVELSRLMMMLRVAEDHCVMHV